MKNQDSIVLKIEMAMMFLDLKVLLLLVFFADMYRKTSLLADFQNKRAPIAETLNWVWQDSISGYIKWVPIVIIGDIILKWILRGLHDD